MAGEATGDSATEIERAIRQLFASLRLTRKRDLDHKSFSGPKSALLRRLSDDELVKWTAKWAPGTAARLAGEREMKRRKNCSIALRAWIALGISLAALALSIAAFMRS